MKNLIPFDVMDSALSQDTEEKTRTAVGRSIAFGAMENPDAHAKVLSLSDETGLPYDTVKRNTPEIETRKKLNDADIQLIFNETPEAQQWLSDKSNAALVSDDFSVIGKMKKTLTDLPKSWELGLDTNELINLRALEIAGQPLSAEQSARASALSAGLDTKTGTGGWLSDALNISAQTLPQLGYTAAAAFKGGSQGAIAGGTGAFLLGQMGPQVAFPEEIITVPGAAVLGGRAGAIAGTAHESYRQQSALAYDDMLKIKDDAGNSIDQETARGAAISVGLINAPLDFLGLDKLTNTMPGVAALKQRIQRDGLKKALQVPGVRAAFLAVGKRFAGGVATEGLTEAAQEAVQIIGEEMAKAGSQGDFESPTMGEAVSRVAEAGKGGALVGGTLGTVGSAASLPLEIRRAREFTPDQVAAHVDGINEAVKSSTLYQRSPSRFRALVSDLAGEERFYINSTAALDTIKTMTPDDQLALFSALPDLRDELETAASTNADVSINKADYAAYIAPLQGSENLRNFIKLDPADMSVAERDEYQNFIANNPEVVKQIEADIQAQPISPQESFDAVESVVRRAMQDAGRPAIEANAVAPLFARTISRFAAPFGKSGLDVLNQTSLQFQQVNEQGQAFTSGSSVGVMLKDLAKMEAGQLPDVDEVTSAALADLGQKLDSLGLTTKQALAMGAEKVAGLLNPAGESMTLNQKPVKSLEKLQGEWVSRFNAETSIYERDSGKEIHLGKIELDKEDRGKGSGSQIMRELTDYADATGQRITLSPSRDFGGSSVGRLKDFYKRFGFVENKGKNKDFTTKETMYREPVSRTLQQAERGSIELDAALRRVVVSFTSRANLSTAAHEFSHFGVAMHRNFAALAREQIASGNTALELQRIAEDWETMKKAVGAESDTFTVDQEEKLARMFEAYLREGDAPSEGLRRVFTRFRDWLTKIYRDVSALGTSLNPEVKKVFDRWLASEEEIAAVEGKNSALAEIAQALGMNDDVTAKVADYANSARMRAEEVLYKQLAREQKRRESQGYKKEFARVREQVAAEFAKRPVFAALNFLRDNALRLYVGSREIAQAQFDFAPEDAQPATLQDYDNILNQELAASQLRESAIRVLLSPKPKQPVNLFQVLRVLGGVKPDDGGDLKSMGITSKTAPGVIRKSGLSLDYAREALAQRGYLPEDSTISDVLDLMGQEASGKPVYSPDDIELATQWAAVDEAQRVADEMGIDIEAERFARRGLGNYADVFTKDPSDPAAASPDEVAEMHGFESGIDLLRSLRGAPQFDRAIDSEVRKRLMKMYPDMIAQGRIQNKAVEAIVNDRVLLALDLITKELGGNRKVSMKQFAKTIAQRQVEKMKMREVSYAFRYEVAREKSLREALQAARAGDVQKAQARLQNALVNQVVFKQLTAMKDLREKANALFKRVDEKDKVLAARADLDFVGAARAILHKYGLGGAKFNLAQWKADIAERDPYLQDDLAAFLDLVDADEKPAKELTTREFADVYNAVQNIFHVARKMKEFDRGDKTLQTKEAVASMIEKMGEMKPGPKIEGSQVYGKARVHSNIMALKALVRRVEHWAQNMDGGFGGPFRSYLWQPISDASVAYRDARSKWITDLHAILSEHKERLTEKGKIPTTLTKYDGTTFVMRDRMELIGLLLHTGNESNLEKLLGGYGFERQAFEQEMNRLQETGVLQKEDYDLVQRLWDFAEELKPLSQRAHRQLYGFRFEEIEPAQFLTQFGAYRGGYWPATIDRDQVDMKGQDEKRFLLASTNKGFTKSRVRGFRKQLSTDLRLASQHVDQVLRFSYLEPAVSQVRRLLNDDDLRSSLKAIDARAHNDMLMPWLDRVARQITAEPLSTGGETLLGRGAKFLRQSASAQTMMGNIGNAIQNFTGFTVAIHSVGTRNFAKAFAEYVKNPVVVGKEIKEQSAFMRVRQNVNEIDLSNEIKEIVLRTGYYTKIKDAAVKHGYILQRVSQGIVDNITWSAAYSKAIEDGKSNADAVAYADSVVRTTQSSSAPEDISKIEAGSELAKPLLMFYTYFNNLANLVGTETDTIMRKYGWSGSPKLFYLYLMTISLPAVFGDLIVRGLRDDLPKDDDDDGEVLDDWLAYISGSQIRFLAASVPYIGQAINAGVNAFNKRPFDDRITASPVISQGETALRFITKEIKGGYTDKSQEVRDGLNAIGFLTGLPLGQLGKPAGFLADVAEGDAQPQDFGDYARGLAGGPAPSR